MTGTGCYAKQYSDQLICHKCGLIWDVNDPDPPECQRKTSSAKPSTKNQPSIETPTRSSEYVEQRIEYR